MITYLLRDVPDALWRRVKARARSEGRTIRGLLLILLTRYATHGIREDDQR